jgi:pectin lyase
MRKVASWGTWLGALAIGVGCGGEGSTGEPGADVGDNAAAITSATGTGPTGFATGVTGGAGGPVVRVTTPAELEYELCRNAVGGTCLDQDSRVIEIASIIDLTDSEGIGTATGCYATQVCAPPAKSEVTLAMYPYQQPYCQGKPTSMYTYQVAGLQGMLVGSNKTVIGTGSGAGVKGKGFLLQTGVSNIIIRNLSITDINHGLVFGGDAITVADASRVWIDHDYIARIGRQFIVTGTGDKTGASDEVTISNNEFDGRTEYAARCDGVHYWNLLLYGHGGVTLAGNWIHDFSGRAPRIDAGSDGTTVQIVDNYFQHGTWHALDYEGSPTQVLMEGNYFDGVSQPVVTPESDVGRLYGIYDQTAASHAACSGALGRWCRANVSAPAPSQDYLVQDADVLQTARAVSGRLVKPYSASAVPTIVREHAGVGHI